MNAMTHFATGSRVRLIPPARVRQPEIGEAEGRVLESVDGTVYVQWQGDRLSWNRNEDLEAAA